MCGELTIASNIIACLNSYFSFCIKQNRRACMKNCLNEEESKRICKDRSTWLFVVSTYPYEKRCNIMNVKLSYSYFQLNLLSFFVYLYSRNGRIPCHETYDIIQQIVAS